MTVDHDFIPRQGPFGDEEHECPCGGITKVCDTCGRDYHEEENERNNCQFKK